MPFKLYFAEPTHSTTIYKAKLAKIQQISSIVSAYDRCSYFLQCCQSRLIDYNKLYVYFWSLRRKKFGPTEWFQFVCYRHDHLLQLLIYILYFNNDIDYRLIIFNRSRWSGSEWHVRYFFLQHNLFLHAYIQFFLPATYMGTSQCS